MKKIGWDILFRDGVSWGGREHFECIDGNVSDLIVWFIFICLCPPALCILLYHIKSLPSFISLGRSHFLQEGSLSLFSSYPSNSPYLFHGVAADFFVCCLGSCVCFSSWYPGMIFGTETKMEQLGFLICRMWDLVSWRWVRLHPPVARRGHSVQGADRLSVLQLRYLLNFQ